MAMGFGFGKPLVKKVNSHVDPKEVLFVEKTEKDSKIACNIVDHLFGYINACCDGNKSKEKMNLLTKGFVRSILTENSKNGIKGFINNMYDSEISSLLDDIQKELNKREKY